MMMTRNEAALWLTERDNYCILTHRKPDGDTAGSAAALCLGLRQLGKKAVILKNPELTPRYAFLHAGLTVDAPEEDMTLVSVDVAAPNMLPKAFEPYRDRIALRIDHHGTATSFTPEELVDGESASCAELICDLVTLLGIQMDKSIANAVYVGLSTDTGCFRFANTTAHSFLVAAVCAGNGADIHALNQKFFETNTRSKLRMQAWIVENMKVFAEGKLAVVAIPKSVEEAIGVTEDDMDNISSFPRTVAGVCMAATLRETKDGDVKLSVRAIPGYDATVVTGAFGGGGHRGAAGATLKMSLKDAALAVEKAMLEL